MVAFDETEYYLQGYGDSEVRRNRIFSRWLLKMTATLQLVSAIATILEAMDKAEFLRMTGGVAGIYYFNKNEVTYCCEVTPSYSLEYVRSEPRNYPDDCDDESDDVLDWLDEVNRFSWENCKYIHCRSLDRNNKVLVLDDFSEVSEEEFKEESEMDNFSLDQYIQERCRPDEFYPSKPFYPWDNS
jgi:hypothetical protein